jgi:hypothetical protein
MCGCGTANASDAIGRAQAWIAGSVATLGMPDQNHDVCGLPLFKNICRSHMLAITGVQWQFWPRCKSANQ